GPAGVPERAEARAHHQASARGAALLPLGRRPRPGSSPAQGARAVPRRAEGDSGPRTRVIEQPPVDRPQRFVDQPDQLAACVDDVARSARVGLDTESNGFHAYFEKVCLLQVSTEEADWAVDPLALELGPL